MYRVSQFLNSSDRIFHVGTNWASSPAWRARSSGPAAYTQASTWVSATLRAFGDGVANDLNTPRSVVLVIISW
jgi:hypothetical protein